MKPIVRSEAKKEKPVALQLQHILPSLKKNIVICEKSCLFIKNIVKNLLKIIKKYHEEEEEESVLKVCAKCNLKDLWKHHHPSTCCWPPVD